MRIFTSFCLLMLISIFVIAQPAAPSPTASAANVISIFSGAYTNVAGTDFNPNWAQATVVSQPDIAGNSTLKYTNLDYQGIQLASGVNVTAMNTLHLDFWTSNSTSLSIYLISAGPVEKTYPLPLALNQWVSADIPLTTFTNPNVDLSNIIQFKVEGNGTVYLDNIYFSKGGATGSNDYTLVWSDEFSGTGTIATDLWFHQTQLPTGVSWYNGEEQHYTNRIENASTANGLLKITAKKESFTDQGVTKQYTSARLNSKYAFTYGRVDVRAKLAAGAGTWPAIWMLGKNVKEPGGYFFSQFGTVDWPATGEIDIMEHWGNNPNVIHGSIHTPSSSGSTINTNTTTISQVSSSYHTYSLIWDEAKIQFLVDHVLFYTYEPATKNASTWPFDKPQYLLLNIAMGGVGGVIDPAFTTTTMEIDYVRVYQKGVTPLPTPPKNNQTINFPALTDRPFSNTAFALIGTSSSTLPVAYSTASDKVTISGSLVTIVKAGRVTIKANQAGNESYNAAPEVSQSFCILPPKPTVTITQISSDAITLTSSAATGNKWYLNGTPIPSGVNAIFSASAAGIYKVQVTADDCVSEFSADAPVIITGDLANYSSSVNVYPNPAENYLELSGVAGELSDAQLFDLAGRREFIAFEKRGDLYQANLQHLAKGIYLLQLQQGSVLSRFKVVKK